MSKDDFPVEEFGDRRRSLSRSMADAGVDWLIAIHPASIHWLTGGESKGYQAFQCLFVSSKDRLTLLVRESERAETEADALVDAVATWGGPQGKEPLAAFADLVARLKITGRVELEVPAYYLHPAYHVGVRTVLGDGLIPAPSKRIHDLRLVKSERELAYVRKAAAIADESVDRLASALAAGRSELEVAGEIYGAIMRAGGGIPASPINLAAGPRSSFSHGAPTERRLQRGDFGNAEYGVPYRRYTATIGRQFCIGAPTPRMQHVFDVARDAADACIAEIADGVPAARPHAAARRVIAAAGLDEGRVHITGYAVAPAFPPATGDALQMADDSDYTLREGMVLSVCPPVFLAAEGLGARVVDNVVVTRGGADVLSRKPRDMIVV